MFKIRSIGYDRYGANHITKRLSAHGIEIVETGQGFVSMNSPSKELEKITKQGKMATGANPILKWMST